MSSHPSKKIKTNNQSHKQPQQCDEQGWIKVQTAPLTVSISDHSKPNKYHSHRSIQKYIRYLTVNTCPNPMWLSIKRQSQIKSIVYIDIEIEGRLFQKMIDQSELEFLQKMDKSDQKAIFRRSPLITNKLWESLFCYDEELAKEEKLPTKVSSESLIPLSEELLQVFRSYQLTPNELRNNLYPIRGLPLYSNYLSTSNQSEKELKNMILSIDCEMVITEKGFELARATICNYEGQVIFDEFFKPQHKILNYNTEYSGITQQILDPITNTIENDLHPRLSEIVTTNTILVGHSLENDLNAMKMLHSNIIDTSVVFQRKNGVKMKLKNLAYKILNRVIQVDTHDSIEDCTATLDLLKVKVHSEMQQKPQQTISQYHLLKELSREGNKVLIIDHEIDRMQKYTNLRFEKVDQGTSSESRLGILCKYLEQELQEMRQHSKPPLFITRLMKNQEKQQWEEYYQNVNNEIENMFQKLRKGTLLFLNFQLNESIQIILPNQNGIIQRPFCLISAKN